MKSFKITEKDGIAYSKRSGDNNEIHLSELAGYNSIFGEKICHGTFVLEKILKIINFKKILNKEKKLKIKVNFYYPAYYGEKIYLKKRRNEYFEIYQGKKRIIDILFLKKTKNYSEKILNPNKSKIFKNTIFQKNKSYEEKIYFILSIISKYVGKFYPGKYSIIKEIELILEDAKFINERKIKIRSKKLNKKFPMINNQLSSRNLTVNFLSLIRPKIINDKTKLKQKLIGKIKKIKYNALILGGSQGIGRVIFEILKKNNNIIKIITYNKNLIKLNNKKTFSFKFDINKNHFTLQKYIKKYSPLRIFYFISPKIFFDKKLSKEKYKELKIFFLDFPKKILNKTYNHRLSFFYPSTSNINKDKSADYSKIKFQAELQLAKICKKNNIKFQTLRLPAINSRQSISLINPNPVSFTEYLNSNYESFKKIFL